MLEHTFLHLPHVKTVANELKLWNSGILTIDDLLIESSASEVPSWYQETKEALLTNDHNYFADRLTTDQHYRLALAYPRQTIFFDIETTGFSHNYNDITIIGWSLDTQFKVMVVGRDNPEEFFDDLARSKAMVTFNGRCFDVHFLKKTFPNLCLPKAHIDLKYLCRKVELTGGQKAIEFKIGHSREIGQGDGQRAIELWYTYRNKPNIAVKKAALKELIIYNYADVEAMKFILDACIEKFFELRLIPKAYKQHFESLSRNLDFQNSFPFSLEPF
jgi:uncharacterized protein YprB with RNaseH-like and TPR domain